MAMRLIVPRTSISVCMRLSGRTASVRLEHLGQLIWRNGTTKEVPLSIVALVCPQELQIFNCFNSLSVNAQVKAPSHVDEGFHGGRSTGNGADPPEKRAIDLESIDG